MHTIALVTSLLTAAHYAHATPPQDTESRDNEPLATTQFSSITIASSASTPCPSGAVRSKWSSCSASVSSAIDACASTDLTCACSHANAGFACLTTFCPQNTPSICEASLALHGLCALARAPGPTLTHFACPTTIPNLLASFIPSEVRSLMPGALTGALPSDVIDALPTEMVVWDGGGDVTTSSEESVAAIATATGIETDGMAPDSGSAKVRIDGLETVLGVGVGVSVVVVVLSAWV